jgi:hypothetical protein
MKHKEKSSTALDTWLACQLWLPGDNRRRAHVNDRQQQFECVCNAEAEASRQPGTGPPRIILG